MRNTSALAVMTGLLVPVLSLPGPFYGVSEEETTVTGVHPAPSERNQPYWHDIGSNAFPSVTHSRRLHDTGDSQNEFGLSWGGWEEDPYRRGFSRPFPNAGGLFLWVSESKVGERELWKAGLGSDLSFLSLGPARVFSRIQIGLGYATENLHHGVVAVTAVGLGSGVWLGRRCQLLITLDHDFNLPGRDTTPVALEVRWFIPKLPFPIYGD